jgi:ribose 1,5-bisphosphokinase
VTGQLICCIGASGAGKDTLLAGAREKNPEPDGIFFAHRYITRPARAEGENHIALSAAEFESRRRRGFFALQWEAHNLRYGIGCEINRWMEAGGTVIVNTSREYLASQEKVPAHWYTLLITVDESVLRRRLQSRGRETPSEIEERLNRNRMMTHRFPHASVVWNNTTVEDGVSECIRKINTIRRQI